MTNGDYGFEAQSESGWMGKKIFEGEGDREEQFPVSFCWKNNTSQGYRMKFAISQFKQQKTRVIEL